MKVIAVSILLLIIAYFLIASCLNRKKDRLTGDVMDEYKQKLVTECTPAQKRDNFIIYTIMLVLVGVMIWQVIELLGV